MKLTICIGVLAEAVTQFVHTAGFEVFFGGSTGKVIVIHKVIARIIRRVDINHLHLTHVRAL